MAKSTQGLLWYFVLFIASSAMAQTPNKMSPQDQQLLALLQNAKVPENDTPPKLNNQDIYTIQPTREVNPIITPDPASQRCMYNNKAYVLGDMIKTQQGWLKCTPTISFSSDNPTIGQNGVSAWIKVQ